MTAVLNGTQGCSAGIRPQGSPKLTIRPSLLACRLVEPGLHVELPLLLEVLVRDDIVVPDHRNPAVDCTLLYGSFCPSSNQRSVYPVIISAHLLRSTASLLYRQRERRQAKEQPSIRRVLSDPTKTCRCILSGIGGQS